MKKLIATTLTLLACAACGHAAENRPLNIVFIMADDHGRGAVSCYGSKLIQTPQIDRLAREGVRFDQAMANNSICSPSRASLLTGKYNHLCGVRKLNDHFDGAQQTFPKLLQQAGYQTAIVGKWHLFTQPTGFDFYSVLPGQGRYVDPPLKETGQPWGNGNKDGVEHKGYITDIITDISLDWLKHRDTSKPFCLLIHHKAPHSPHEPAERYKDLFKDTVFPEPSNLVDDYAGRAPEKVADMLVWSRLVQIDYPQYQAYLKGYLRLVAALDENVGRVLDYLDQSGLATNTVVIYTSDNGFFTGEHGFYNKMWMYEESLHVPMLIRLPPGAGSVKAGTVNHDLVSILDLAPTILDLAGVKAPADIQGRSMKPLLTGASAAWRDKFYYHYYGVVGMSLTNWIGSHEIMGVRTKTAKLVFYPTWKGGPFWEYFDLVNDPHEMQNLYHTPAQQPAVTALKKDLRSLTEQYRDTEAAKLLDEAKAE
jgi:arylsulfatase A-like enzyme